MEQRAADPSRARRLANAPGSDPSSGSARPRPRNGRSSAADTERIRRQILEAIRRSVDLRGYPPSIRELASSVGLSSPSSVHAHLGVLEARGLLRRDPARPRALALAEPEASASTSSNEPLGAPADEASLRYRSVAVLGLVGAGTGVLAEQREEADPLVLDRTLLGDGEHFALVVRGESMRDAGILDGDFVVVRRQTDAPDGTVVVAGIAGDEGTVKILRRGRGGRVTLVPANPEYSPIEVDASDLVIYGQVVSVIRRLR